MFLEGALQWKPNLIFFLDPKERQRSTPRPSKKSQSIFKFYFYNQTWTIAHSSDEIQDTKIHFDLKIVSAYSIGL